MNSRDSWEQSLLETAADPAAQPRRICELCVPRLGVTGAGLSMVTRSGNRSVLSATDVVAGRIEELQLISGEGPCVDAVRTRRPILIPDLQERDVLVERWPAFTTGAAEAGVCAVFAFPLNIGRTTVGALDLYRDQRGDLSDRQIADAQQAADAAAVGLLHLGRRAGGVAGTDWAADATGQMQVHQATGMVMAQLGVSVDEAFLRLRARAFGDGRALADVATDVVGRRLRFSQEDQ